MSLNISQKYRGRENFLDDPIEEEDDILCSLHEEHDTQGIFSPLSFI